jgi:hypothetical protein
VKRKTTSTTPSPAPKLDQNALAGRPRKSARPRTPSRLAIRADHIEAHGALGVLCAGVVELGRQRPWLAGVALLVVTAALALAAFAPGLLGRVGALW